MSFEILVGLSSESADLLPETMMVTAPGHLLRMALRQFAASLFDYELTDLAVSAHRIGAICG